MDCHFVAFAGPVLKGADALRECLRWAAAERRWHGPQPFPHGHPPTVSPSGLDALRHGAQLTRYTETGRARAC